MLKEKPFKMVRSLIAECHAAVTIRTTSSPSRERNISSNVLCRMTAFLKRWFLTYAARHQSHALPYTGVLAPCLYTSTRENFEFIIDHASQ